MGGVSWWHWLIVLAVVLLLFGGKKIPELMKGLGTGIKGFKKAVKEDEEDGELQRGHIDAKIDHTLSSPRIAPNSTEVQVLPQAIAHQPSAEQPPIKRGRGRPRKNPLAQTAPAAKKTPTKTTKKKSTPKKSQNIEIPQALDANGMPIKRGRGRPRKNPLA